MLSDLFPQLIAGKSLTHHQMQEVLSCCIDGSLEDETIADFLKLMHEKGETIEELTAAAMILQDCAHHIDLGPDLVDIVGTGGDGKNLFNVSTVTSFVAAAAGCRVRRRGSRCGWLSQLRFCGTHLTPMCRACSITPSGTTPTSAATDRGTAPTRPRSGNTQSAARPKFRARNRPCVQTPTATAPPC